MFGLGYNRLSKESENLVKNILENFKQMPIYSAYDIVSFRNPNGVISLVVSKNESLVNRFDFYSDGEKGKIGSVTIYGSNLRGHANAIRSSMKIFFLPVVEVSYEYDLVDVTLDDYDVDKLKNVSIIDSLLSGNNNPDIGECTFDSSDHIRYHYGQDMSGHNYNCHRQINIKKNINGGIGYTVTIYNQDSIHPLWGNNVQMAPKQMRIERVANNIVSLVGFGSDSLGNSFSDYAIDVYFHDKDIDKIVLKMLDRNIELEYLK